MPRKRRKTMTTMADHAVRVAAVKKAQELLRLTEQEYTEAYNKGDMKTMAKAKKEMKTIRKNIIDLAEPTDGEPPVDKRLYNL
jgi:hypothetical protein